MAEEKTTQEEATTPEPEFNAAEALKALEAEESEQSEAVTADEDKTEESTDETVGEEGSQEGDNADEENDLPELSGPILKAIGDNAEAKEAWDRHWKGVQKKEKQLSEREQAITSDENGWGVYKSYADAFSDPESWQKAYEYLGQQLSTLHKAGPVEKKEEVKPEEHNDGTLTYDGQTFYSLAEVELYKRVQSLEAKLSEAPEARPDPELEEIKAERKAQKEQEALNTWVDTHQKSLIAKVAAKTGGWGITKEQIAAVAKVNKKGLEADPVATLKGAYPDAYAEWRVSGQRKFEIKDMVSGSQAKGFEVPDNPDEYSAKHALMELSG